VKLELQNVSKRVGADEHLYSLDLTLSSGLNVLLGPTLAGKTSLMRLVAGLDKPSTGRVVLDGQDVTKTRVQRRSVAFVYQQFINYPSLSVFENIASPLRVEGGLSRAQLTERVHEVAKLMRIDPFLRRLPAELSGGQQQRTAIARALVKEADILLMDEPLVNLDYKLREELRAEMKGIFRGRDAIVVYATTEPYEALLLGGVTTVLDEGRVLQSGPTLEVYHRPVSQRVGEVFSDPPINVLAGTIAEGNLKLEAGPSLPLPEHMQSLPPGPYRVGLRATHAGLGRTLPDDVAVPATVELSEISGSETFVHMNLADQAHVVAQLGGVHPVAAGEHVNLHLNPKRLFIFDTAGQLQAAPERAAASGSVPGPGL